MINRVSTASQYQSLTSNLMRKQGEVNESNNQLSTGKRVETAGDDPVSSVTIQNYRQQLTQIDQYKSAITMVNNRLGVMESSIAGVEDNLDATKQKVLRMINGAMASNDRTAFKDELTSLRDGLLELANSRDESGNYVFAGNQMDTQPFVKGTDGKMNYQGDSQSRYAQIDKSVEVKTSLPGDQLFTSIPNPYGDFRPDFSDLSSGSKLHVLSATTSDFTKAQPIDIAFSEAIVTQPDGSEKTVMQYNLSLDGKEVVADQDYDPEKGIQYTAADGSSVSIILDDVEVGDKLTLNPAQKINIFDSLQDAIDNAEKPTSSAAAEATLQRVIDDIDSSFLHVSQRRSEVGTIMQQVERQQEQHLDFELTLNSAQSGLEDLDYSKAIMEMNQQMMALQASQSAFSKTKQLSLFNYL